MSTLSSVRPSLAVEPQADLFHVGLIDHAAGEPGAGKPYRFVAPDEPLEPTPGKHDWRAGLSFEDQLAEAARRAHLRASAPLTDLFAVKVVDIPAMLRARAAAVLASGGKDTDLGLYPRPIDALGKLDIRALTSVRSPLVTTRVELPPPSKSLDSRQLRAVVRNHVRRLWPMNSNLRKCGERRYQGAVELRGKNVERRDGKTTSLAVAGMVSGVVRCGSVHDCIKCAPRISSVRARIVKTVITAHREATATEANPEGGVDMLTLTVPHRRLMRLKRLRSYVSKALRAMQTGAPWQRLKRDMGFVGTIAARETTHGFENGWHPHIHVLLAHSRPWSDRDRLHFRRRFYVLWCRAVEKVSGGRITRPSYAHGVHLAASYRDDYIQKLGLADELTGALNKTGHAGSRTPFQIQAQYANHHDDADAALIVEHMRGMKGARQLTWSRGKKGSTDLRRVYAWALIEPTPEQTDLGGDYLRAFESDVELVQREDRDGVMIGALPGRQWDALVRVLRRVGGDAESEIQLAIETGGNESVAAVIAAALALGVRLAGKDPRLRAWLPYLDGTGNPHLAPYRLRTPRKRGAPLPSLSNA